jgi:general secretion pathway protein K
MKSHSHHQAPKREEGVVLVVALFIVALVAGISYLMVFRLDRDARRTSLLIRNTQAELYAQGSIAWAMDQLHDDWVKQKNNKVIDPTPIESPENEVNGYKIKSTITDMQARFNINNVAEVDSQADFRRLLHYVDRELSPSQVDEIAKNVTTWISPKGQNDVAGRYYLELKKPYRMANRPMLSISELRLVKGITGKLYHALLPYITALPEVTPINVQTTSAPIFSSISETMTPDMAMALIELRKRTPILSMDNFKNLGLIKDHPVPEKKITVYSQYFLVETTVCIDDQRLVIYTLLARRADEANAAVNIVWQSKGVW